MMRGSLLQKSTWALVAFLVGLPGMLRAQPGGLSDIVEEAWSAVDSTYYDAAFHGVDWDALRDTYGQRQYADTQEAYAAVREMLDRLGNPARRFLTPAQTTALLADFAGGPQNGIGLLELLSIDTDKATGEQYAQAASHLTQLLDDPRK